MKKAIVVGSGAGGATVANVALWTKLTCLA